MKKMTVSFACPLMPKLSASGYSHSDKYQHNLLYIYNTPHGSQKKAEKHTNLALYTQTLAYSFNN